MTSKLEEWNKQQKMLREAERQRKKGATTLLRTYRGGEHDIKDHERKVAQEKTEQLARKQSAIRHLYGYGHQKRNSIPKSQGKDTSESTCNDRGSVEQCDVQDEHLMTTDPIGVYLSSSTQPNGDSNLAMEIHQQRQDKHQSLNSEEKDDSGRDELTIVDGIDTHVKARTSSQTTYPPNRDSTKLAEETKIDEKKNTPPEREDYLLTNNDHYDERKSSITKCIKVGFQFGLLFNKSEPKPNKQICHQAALDIVPKTLSRGIGSRMTCKLTTHPPIVSTVSIDPEYSHEDDGAKALYIVKGKLPMFFLLSNLSTTKSSSTSSTPMRDPEESNKREEVEHQEQRRRLDSILIVGDPSSDRPQWIRVRKGLNTRTLNDILESESRIRSK